MSAAAAGSDEIGGGRREGGRKATVLAAPDRSLELLCTRDKRRYTMEESHDAQQSDPKAAKIAIGKLV